MLKRYRSAAIAVTALFVTSTVIFAAGNYSTLPIVEGSSYCASTVTGTGSLSGVTGQGQGTTGSICAQTVPAGPTAVTGYEVVPADLYRPDVAPASLGAQPQTALLSMASLNALPITVATVITGATGNTLVAAATSGGYILHSTASVTSVVLTLPTAPIDGQQFALSADQLITSLTLTSGTGASITKNPTVLTPSTTGTYGYRFMYNAAATNWYRLN